MSTNSNGSSQTPRRRPQAVAVLAVLVATAGIGAVLAVLAGAAIHGLSDLQAIEGLIVAGALALAALCLAVAYGAWTLKPWAWTLGLVAGIATILYLAAVLARGWADLMVDAPALAAVALLVLVIAAAGLLIWSRPEIKAAFGRD